jgi:AcrR family transcriptional regulator
MSDVKRRYTSTRRQAQAEATRRAITAAARQLFVERGYAATSVREIAREAGVAEPTVYATFGNKRNLLVALHDELDAEAGVDALLHDLESTAGDHLRQLRLIVAFDRRLLERAADLFEAANLARGADPELAGVLRAGHERGRRGRLPIVTRWQADGVLRDGLSIEEAIDRFMTLCSPELYLLLIRESGWSGDQYEAWLVETLAFTLFGVTTSDTADQDVNEPV